LRDLFRVTPKYKRPDLFGAFVFVEAVNLTSGAKGFRSSGIFAGNQHGKRQRDI